MRAVISLRLMEDTMDDYVAMRNWFLEPELQEWVWCDQVVELEKSNLED